MVILEYIYAGTLETVAPELCEELYQAAHIYELPGVYKCAFVW